MNKSVLGIIAAGTLALGVSFPNAASAAHVEVYGGVTVTAGPVQLSAWPRFRDGLLGRRHHHCPPPRYHYGPPPRHYYRYGPPPPPRFHHAPPPGRRHYGPPPRHHR